MYGLIADSVDVSADRSSATFTINPAARWHDGTPITPEDVVFSFAALRDKGDPTYRILFSPIAGVEKTGHRSITFTFTDKTNRELPLVAASMPVLPAHYYAANDFEKTTLEPPLGSGPYRIESVDAGRSLTYALLPDYWGRNLPINRGQNNFAKIRYDMYRDENVALEAFKAGEYDFRQEYIARNWATAYESPALAAGKFIKRTVPDGRPQGMQAFAYNTRKPALSDRRVREAVGLSMDFAWLNRTIFFSAYMRNDSYFNNTQFASSGVPTGAELSLLKSFAKDLPPALFTQPFKLPETDGSGNARANLVKAQTLLEEAGWIIKDGKRVNAKTGEKLSLEFMLRQPTMERVIAPMRKNLAKLGIDTFIRLVDDAQYQKRIDSHDFDIVTMWINRGVFFPGSEQVSLWQSSQADVKGSNNITGVKNPAIDALLARISNARSLEELTSAARALDRILLWEHYAIPHWRSGTFRVAYWDKFGMPEKPPIYSLGFQTWWKK
jgi:microcin C transport system substrate-binding protein